MFYVVQKFARNLRYSFVSTPEHIPSPRLLLHEPRWAELTFAQLYKDAALCGIDWPEAPVPADYSSWISWLYAHLLRMERQNPENLSRFLYRVDLPERSFREAPFASEAMAEAVLKRAFLKVWLRNHL